MKHLDLSERVLSKDFGICLKKIFSEEEILEIQDRFLNPGFHYIKVESFLVGRNLFKTFSGILKYYSNKAYLSELPFDYSLNMFNLFQEFIDRGIIHDQPGALEDFLLNSFFYDFLAIEVTDKLLLKPWMSKFENLLIDYYFTETLPIIVLYKNHIF